MPQLHQNVSKFEIQRQLATGPNFKANVYDKLALINMWNQYPYEDITNQLANKYLNDTPDAPVAPFTDWLRTGNRTMTVSEPFVRFKKIGRTNTHFRIMRTSSDSYPGVQGKEFDIVLNTDMLKPGSKVGPEESFKDIVTIQSMPENYGDGYKYRARYHSTDPDAYMPAWALREGTRWVPAGGASFSERSLDYGPVMLEHGHSILVYQIPLFNAAYEVELTDEAIVNNFNTNRGVDQMNVNYVYNITDKAGKLPATTISDAELRIKLAMDANMDRDLLFGRASFPIQDTSTGLARKTGAGILNQLEDGNTYRYARSNFRIQEITDYLDTVWNTPGGRLQFWVGKESWKLVNQAIRREYGDHTFIENFDDYVERTGRPYPGGVETWKLKRPMFTAIELQPWGVVEFVHQRWMDDRNWRGPKDPLTGTPLLSWHIIGNKYSGEGMNSSIKLVTRPDMEFYNFQPGVVGPRGHINNGTGGGAAPTHGGRYGHLRYQKEYGTFTDNINDWIWFFPAIK